MANNRQPALTIVGLGPSSAKYLTGEAMQVLRSVPEIWLRTARHPAGRLLARRHSVHSFDDVYAEVATLEEGHKLLAERVIALALRPEGVVYAVPGHPMIGEPSVSRTLELATSHDFPIRIIAGLSPLDEVLAILRVDPLANGLHVLDASSLIGWGTVSSEHADGDRWHHLLASRPVRPTLPSLVCNLFDRGQGKRLKDILVQTYPSEHPVSFVAHKPAGSRKIELTLSELGKQRRADHPACLYLPPVALLDDLASFDTLRHIVARLRAPGGCPWDREQTHRTLKPYLIEESYEVLEALDNAAMPELEEELGDLLLQIVLHAQLAAEANSFDISDVVAGIGAKLIRRHPHVFGSVRVANTTEVLRNWEQIKQAEKGDERGAKTTLLGGLPREMPALSRARSIQRRVADLGFDWDDISGALAKVREEAGELEAAGNIEERRAELGDLLFALVSLGRFLGLDAEECLRLANERFVRRFHRLEEIVRQSGLALKELPLDEITRLWQLAKLG